MASNLDDTLQGINDALSSVQLNSQQLNLELERLGTLLRDSTIRAQKSKLSGTIRALADSVTNGQLRDDSDVKSFRVFINFVADSNENVEFILKEYDNSYSFFQNVFTGLVSSETSQDAKAYRCIFLLNFIIGGDESGTTSGASYIDSFEFEADGRKTSAWNELLELLCQDDRLHLNSKVVDILDELANVDDEQSSTKSAINSLSLQRLLQMYEWLDEDIFLSIFERVTLNKQIELNNEQSLVFRVLDLLKCVSNQSDASLLFRSGMNLSYNSTNNNDQLTRYLTLWKENQEQPLLRSLILIILSNYVVSKENKDKLIDEPLMKSVVEDFFQHDYKMFTESSEFKHLELESTVLMNKLITDERILKVFEPSFLVSFVQHLRGILRNRTYQQMFKELLLLNVRFSERLVFSYQVNASIKLPRQEFETIVDFISGSEVSESVEYERGIDLIRFSLINLMVITGQYNEDLNKIVNATFGADQDRFSENSGPIPFNYVFEETKTVALLLTKDTDIIRAPWFERFFETLQLVVTQNPTWKILINNYKFICGKIENANQPSLIQRQIV
ncbi:DEKNAAC100074 [Brettanomyces naardenensis]|uniref:DEKNAAC100074 n=1 Tax=Brettanomyces naardenensis TaxID=13370 RepID=A0A448YG03_BRENA|nr:DEKNAAC100074 [Brettanomyces naardenensis]